MCVCVRVCVNVWLTADWRPVADSAKHQSVCREADTNIAGYFFQFLLLLSKTKYKTKNCERLYCLVTLYIAMSGLRKYASQTSAIEQAMGSPTIAS